MPETEPRTAGQAARPRPSSPRLSSSPAGAAATRALPSRAPLSDHDRRQTARRTARVPPRGTRVSRSEARLLTWAVVSAITVCGLLVLHLAAYAHLTLLRMEQAKAKQELHEKGLQNQILRAQEAALESPDRIAACAVRLGLTKKSSRVVDYIRPAPAGTAVPSSPAKVALGGAALVDAPPDDRVTEAGGRSGPQRTNSGPNTQDNLANRDD